jgi:phospholipid/cholesterol/gamma-HCH transport system substrate-binding protein
MSRQSRYRASEIKAGIWIFLSLVIFAVFMFLITGSKFWNKTDHYRVRLKYVGGLEVGSPIRMGGLLVGKVGEVKILPSPESGIELTLEVNKGLPVKENTSAYLSFISITSEQHLELEQSPEPAPLLSPGDLISSKELTTMDDIMEQIGYVGDTLRVILSQVHDLLKPANVAQIDSILAGINSIIQESEPDIAGLIRDSRRTVASLDTLIYSINELVEEGDTLLVNILADTRQALQQATAALARIDSTVENVDRIVADNSSNLSRFLDNLNQTSQNLKVLTSLVKDNPFLLIRAFPKKERKLSR